MKIISANYLSSYVDWKECPDKLVPEYAFIGRSNVGKSSLINVLVNKVKLAKVSGTPGKTQCMNFFKINEAWNLVDLPGYGFVKIGKKKSKQWLDTTKAYMKNRRQLVYVFLLIDSRVPPQKKDLDFMEWLGAHGVPFVIVYTKNDHPKETKRNRAAFEEKMLENWEELPPIFTTSAAKREGLKDILEFISEMNESFELALKSEGLV